MQVKEYHLVWWRRWLARPFLRGVFRLLFHSLARVKVTGKENVPRGKPYLAAINHVSLFEAPFMAAFWPEYLEALGASDVWERPGQNVLARLWGGIPVHRGEYDRAAVEGVLSVLRNGHPLLIAPEGGRSHAPGMRAAKPGIAFLVEQAGVLVVPVGIVGSTDDFLAKALKGKRPPLEMHIGKPIQLPLIEGSGAAKRLARQENADLVMRHVAGLLPEEYRGVYAGNAIFQE